MDELLPLRLNNMNQAGPVKPQGESDVNAVNDSFKNVLNEAIKKVSESQNKADDAIAQLSSGNMENVHQAMIALEEANIVLQFTVQLRNKVVDAYQEIMHMQM